jgi:hypothetical protein
MKDDSEFNIKFVQAVESQPYLYDNCKDGYSMVTAFQKFSSFLVPVFAPVT